MTKETGGGLLLSESTRGGLGRESGELVRQGEIEVRGRAQRVVVWLLPSEPEGLQPVERTAATA